MNARQLVADAIAEARTMERGCNADEMRRWIAERTASALLAADPFFDRAAFVAACRLD